MKMLLEKIEKYWSTRTEGYSEVNHKELEGMQKEAWLDVLEAVEPALAGHPLLNRDNVLITPHSAFYSRQSMERLQTISGSNLAYYLNHEPEKVHRVVSLG